MTTNSAWAKSLKRLANIRPTLADYVIEFTAKYSHDDRTAALLAAAKVEDGLLDIIKKRMRPMNSTDDNRLFGPTSPLGAHGTRVEVAYQFKIIGRKTRDDLDAIRLIRNAFAHCRKPIWFSTPEIAEGCRRLTLVDRVGDIPQFKKHPDQTYDDPRDRFLKVGSLYELAFTQIAIPEIDIGLPPVPLD